VLVVTESLRGMDRRRHEKLPVRDARPFLGRCLTGSPLVCLANRGPSEEIVLNLAKSIRQTLKSTWAASESGVAGPSRPDNYRPEIKGPGYCPIAVIGPDGFERTFSIDTGKSGQEDRPVNMVLFAAEVLKALRDALREADAKDSNVMA
jgi:Competence-damaged protein